MHKLVDRRWRIIDNGWLALPRKVGKFLAVGCDFSWKLSAFYIFPVKRFHTVSLTKAHSVLASVRKSSVDVKTSIKPNGIIVGIQPRAYSMV